MANSASRSPNPSVDMRPVSEGMSPMPKPPFRDYGCVASLLPALALYLLFAHGVSVAEEAAVEDTLAAMDGRAVMDEVYRRHQQYPYIYEEQSIVMEDRAGNRDTRKLIRYSRTEEDGTIRFMVIFQHPREVKGVALLANRNPDGSLFKAVYLPALGPKLFESSATGSSGTLMGSDFTVEDLTGETLDEHQYQRGPDQDIENAAHFIVDVFPVGVNSGNDSIQRRHYIRQDNFVIIRTDHYDHNGRVYKRQSMHDLKQIDGEMWRAGMTLMVDQRTWHQTLLKVDRRVFSRDYVPVEMFSADWLFANYPDLPRDEATPADPETPDAAEDAVNPAPVNGAGEQDAPEAEGGTAL